MSWLGKEQIKYHLYKKTLLTLIILVCRGGVLEPEGTVEIKFRRKDLVKTMRRVDPVYLSLAERLGESSCLILIIALYRGLHPPRPCPHFSNTSDGSMHAFTAVLVLIVSSLLFAPGRCVNHILLRTITGSSAQPIDFPLSSEQLWSDAVWALCFGRTGGMEGVTMEGLRAYRAELTEISLR